MKLGHKKEREREMYHRYIVSSVSDYSRNTSVYFLCLLHIWIFVL